ncbi:hypothetical protein T459_14445 [Capsicum annuum]|uniref:Thiamine pyrophosphate enzyme N-terminal TPP-binding domain-containing protein n=1 Tax=Capsicum annuum TaxID=4072 RepID=A0A2G2ZHG0_CAPAN|nr:hypothetical protein T459_14445 [Capsicum annuum]
MHSTWSDAPGSRSSPLAIAASTHPTTSCIACIDERSLAFHAVGYAKSSYKPAVVITSSGTAVSNLHPARLLALLEGSTLFSCNVASSHFKAVQWICIGRGSQPRICSAAVTYSRSTSRAARCWSKPSHQSGQSFRSICEALLQSSCAQW